MVPRYKKKKKSGARDAQSASPKRNIHSPTAVQTPAASPPAETEVRRYVSLTESNGAQSHAVSNRSSQESEMEVAAREKILQMREADLAALSSAYKESERALRQKLQELEAAVGHVSEADAPEDALEDIAKLNDALQAANTNLATELQTVRTELQLMDDKQREFREVATAEKARLLEELDRLNARLAAGDGGAQQDELAREDLLRRLEAADAELRSKDTTIKDFGNQLKELTSHLENAEEEMLSLTRRAEAAEKAVLALEKKHTDEQQLALEKAVSENVAQDNQILATAFENLSKILDLIQSELGLREVMPPPEDLLKLIERFKEVAREVCEKYAELELRNESQRAQLADASSQIESFTANVQTESTIRMENLEEEIRALEGKLAEKESQLAAAYAQKSNMNEQITAITTQLSREQINTADLREQLEMTKASIDELEVKSILIEATHSREVAELREKLRLSEELKQTALTVEAEARRAVAEQQAGYEAVCRKLEAAEAEVSQWANVVDGFKSATNAEVDQLKETLQQLEVKHGNTLTTLSLSLEAKLDAEREQAKLAAAESQRKITDQEKLITQLTEVLALKEHEMNELDHRLRAQIKERCEALSKTTIENLQRRLNGSNRAVIELETEVSQCNLVVEDLNKKVAKLQTELDSIKNKESRTGGFFGLF